MPQVAADEPEVAVTNITTRSPEAYRHYLDGVESISKLYYDEAREHFLKALAIDSTFAMVYYYLSYSGLVADQIKMIYIFSQSLNWNVARISS